MWYNCRVTAPNLVGCLCGDNVLVRCFSRGRYRKRSNRFGYRQIVWRSQQEKVSGNKPAVYANRSDTEKWTNPRQEFCQTLSGVVLSLRNSPRSVSRSIISYPQTKCNIHPSKTLRNALYGFWDVSKGNYPLFSISFVYGFSMACREKIFFFVGFLFRNRRAHASESAAALIQTVLI